jgi:prolipoprotein diacylglyceryltransferase
MKTSTKVLHWLPRILCILSILFISMFSLDAFAPELTLWQQLGGFLIHNIPSFVLLAVLIVAWKWEKVGGIILTILGLALCIFVFILNYKRNHSSVATSLLDTLMVAMPFVLAGILFILSHYRKKKELSGVQSQTPPQS